MIGLGNPGPEYCKTRHNIGFWAIDYLAQGHSITLKGDSHDAQWGMGEIAEKMALLARPRTFMNLSGGSVAGLVKAFDMELGSVIIVHDDLDLPVGRFRQAFGSSSGGHRGVESIIAALGSQNFHRLRIGIGRPQARSSREEITDYVLSPFAPEEAEAVRQAMPEMEKVLQGIMTKEKA